MTLLGQAEEGLLSGRPRSPTSRPSRFMQRVTWKIAAATGLIFLLVLALFSQKNQVRQAAERISGATWSSASAPTQRNLHILIPTNQREVNLCKTLLGLAILGYPTPTLVAWEEDFNEEGILGGGSHKAKVFRVLDYLNKLDSSQDDDLVMMIDAYDIWFQVPLSTLLDRYENVTSLAQARLDSTIGKTAVSAANLTQSILFGAGKRCAPNHPHEIPCWAIPESPLPLNLYGANTDTVIGHNTAWSTRQRYLNSGFIMGPASSVRALFTRAADLILTTPDADPLDNGDHMGDFGYHGSDQSIFMAIFGRQEWMRESLRLAHSPPGTPPRRSTIYSTPIDNVLAPSFAHESTAALNASFAAGHYREWEFGIHLDYWSDFTHQTVNSELDGHWLRYRNVSESVGKDMPARTMWDCPLHLPKVIPRDMRNASLPAPVQELAWEEWVDRRLYTHVCLERFPAAVHFNGIKKDRQIMWEKMWWQGRARGMLEALWREREEQQGPGQRGDGGEHGENGRANVTLDNHRRDPGRESIGGAWTDKGGLLEWGDLCPMDGGDWEREIFRDIK